MATGRLFIVPLERFEIRSKSRRYRAAEWLCPDESDGRRCLLVDGVCVTDLLIYADGTRAIDFFSKKEIGRILEIPKGMILEIGRIRAPLIVETESVHYSCEATPVQVKSALEPLKPYGTQIADTIQSRFSEMERVVSAEDAQYDAINGMKAEPSTEFDIERQTEEISDKKTNAEKRREKKATRKGKKQKHGGIKKIVIPVLLVLVLGFIGFRVVKAFHAKCGNQVAWRYVAESNLLILSGEGDTWDYPMGPLKLATPWERSGYDDNISHLIIDEGITTIGSELFADTAVTEVSIPYSATEIKENAFRGCTQLRSVSVPMSVISIGKDAFRIDTQEEQQWVKIKYAGTTDEWFEMLGDTQIDSSGAFVIVVCTDQWFVQADGYGAYTYLGDDQWEEMKR